MPAEFVHLRLHTEYSLVDGLVRIKPLVGAVASMGMPAVAVTDATNLFGLVKFQRAAVGAGVKPIYGADIWVEDRDPEQEPSRLTILAQNLKGYRAVTELVSDAYLKGQRLGRALIKREWLAEKNQDYIVLSGAKEGEVGRALLEGHDDDAQSYLDEWMGIFGDRFYLEIQLNFF